MCGLPSSLLAPCQQPMLSPLLLICTSTAPPITDSPAMTVGRATDAITDKGMATLAVLKELPVMHMIVDRQVRYQKSYLGTTFDIPKPNSAGPFYLITHGCRVGVFSSLWVLLQLSAFLLPNILTGNVLTLMFKMSAFPSTVACHPLMQLFWVSLMPSCTKR